MTKRKENQSYGPPPPITSLTAEQDLRLRLIKDCLEKDTAQKEDIITIFLALQKQNFILGNCLTNLLEKWPTQKDHNTTSEDQLMFGLLFDNNNWDTSSET